MKHSLFLFLGFLCITCCHAADMPSASHMDHTHKILDFLSRTELCLNSCRNAESAAASLPQLRELEKECAQLVESQRALPEPTVQDYMAVQDQMEAFNTIWEAICKHIERLESEQLISEEMRNILRIAPSN